MKTGSVVSTPSAVAFSSSSSPFSSEESGSEADEIGTGGLVPSESGWSRPSLELDMMRSDSLSLSSYSS